MSHIANALFLYSIAIKVFILAMAIAIHYGTKRST